MLQTEINYDALLTDVANNMDSKETMKLYRHLAENDLFFLLRYLLNREEMNNQWCYNRCVDVQNRPDNHVDLWFRGGYKSTIITYGKTIQDILTDPRRTFNIFSYKAPLANAFVKQISDTLKMSKSLQSIYPDRIPTGKDQDIMLQNASVRLNGSTLTRKEANVMGCGMVEGMSTGTHFDYLLYDDIVTRDNASSKEMMMKTEEAFKLSLNLGTANPIMRLAGTIYAYDDLFCTYFQNNPRFTIRRYPVIGSNGEFNLLSQEQISNKRIDMGAYIFSCQMMLDPVSPEDRVFKVVPDFYQDLPDEVTHFILVDPALSESRKADNSVVINLAVTKDKHIYVDTILSFKTKEPSVIIDNIVMMCKKNRGKRTRLAIETVAFQAALKEPLHKALREADLILSIEELKPHGRQKRERISGLEPFATLKMLHLRKDQTLLMDQFMKYPGVKHDDEIDAMAYIVDFVGHLIPSWKQGDQERLLNQYKRKVDNAQSFNTIKRNDINNVRRPFKWNQMTRDNRY